MGRRIANDAWLSHSAAAKLAGCCTTTIEHYVHVGVIEHRERCGDRPSLSRSSVDEFAQKWRQRVEQREWAASAEASRVRRGQPPATDHVWVDSETFAAMLGWSRIWVARLASEDRVPATKGAGGYWWFRRDDAERYAAARVFIRTQDALRHVCDNDGSTAELAA